MRIALVLSILSAAWAPPPRAEPSGPVDSRVTTVAQEQMSLGELEAFFGSLKPGTPVRLTYANGAEFAGNFKRKEPNEPVIHCEKGFFAARSVPLERVVDVFAIVSSTKTVRIHRNDLHYSGAKQ